MNKWAIVLLSLIGVGMGQVLQADFDYRTIRLNAAISYGNVVESHTEIGTDSDFVVTQEKDRYTVILGASAPLDCGVDLGAEIHVSNSANTPREVWFTASAEIAKTVYGELGSRSSALVGAVGMRIHEPINSDLDLYVKIPMVSKTTTGVHFLGNAEIGLTYQFPSDSIQK